MAPSLSTPLHALLLVAIALAALVVSVRGAHAYRFHALREFAAASPPSSDDLVGLIVIHRHGARYPQPPVNASLVCGDVCGQLSPSGEAMLFSLGQRLQTDYPTFPFQDPAYVAASGSVYNPKRIHAHSTDVDRTVQSAASLLRGLMAPLGAAWSDELQPPHRFVPSVKGVVKSQAKEMLVWASWPNLIVRSTATQVQFDAMMDQRIAGLFSPSDLAAFGREANAEALCASNPFQCALQAQDLITCALSNMPASAASSLFPTCFANYAKLTQVMVDYNSVSMYNASDPFDAQIGTKGYLLAQDILALLEAPGLSATANPLFRDFSGHDITLMPFAETIGNTSLTNPLFAGAFVLELRQDSTARRTIKLRYGEPDQQFNSSFGYNFFDFGLTCVNPNGEPYIAAPTAGCPLDDWARFLATRGPQSAAGICYLSESVLQGVMCLPTQTVSSAPSELTPLCRFYRQSCQQWACLAPSFDTGTPADFAFNPTTLGCESVPRASPSPTSTGGLDSVPRGALVGFTAGATALLLSLLATAIYFCFLAPKRGPAIDPMLIADEGGDTREDPDGLGDGVGCCERFTDAVMRSLCCCCCRDRIRRKDEVFFINGTDASYSDVAAVRRAAASRHSSSTLPAPARPSVSSTVAHRGTVGNQRVGNQQTHPSKQPKLAEITSHDPLPPQRRLSFGDSREPSEA
jgi:hypothetical protein